MAELVGYGVPHQPRSGYIESLRLFFDSIPKDIGNTSHYKSLAAVLYLSRGHWENPKEELSRIHYRWTLRI